MPRSEYELYPDFQAEIDEIDRVGISDALLNKIIDKHAANRMYNWNLHKRYEVLDGEVPIFQRIPRFDEENPVNNKVNNDFFGEIVDFKTGYFAGKPAVYSYADTVESKEDTGGEEARDEASKALSDFVARNNMYDVDMDITKFAAIAGYAGRMFYHDTDGNERCMALPSYETIVLSETSIMEPKYGIRYYKTLGLGGEEIWKAEFDDGKTIRFYEGCAGSLTEKPEKAIPNLFGFCAIQGIPNNSEMLGDVEKVMELIDAYDRTVSDENNEIDSFANAYMAFENIDMSDEEIRRGQRTGAFQYFSNGNQPGSIHFITKDINDAFVEHHLDRLEENIYRFSKTPNMADENFSQNASGVAMKFKLTGLEAKCGMFQAKMITAGVYMFKLLAGCWAKKRIPCDPLQCYITFKRNFPVDLQNEAQAVSAIISSGMPKRIAFSQYSFVDDVEEVMQLIEEEKDDIPNLYTDTKEDQEDEQDKDKKPPEGSEDEEDVEE
jgi:SPP1 family phage portal protein